MRSFTKGRNVAQELFSGQEWQAHCKRRLPPFFLLSKRLTSPSTGSPCAPRPQTLTCRNPRTRLHRSPTQPVLGGVGREAGSPWGCGMLWREKDGATVLCVLGFFLHRFADSTRVWQLHNGAATSGLSAALLETLSLRFPAAPTPPATGGARAAMLGHICRFRFGPA